MAKGPSQLSLQKTRQGNAAEIAFGFAAVDSTDQIEFNYGLRFYSAQEQVSSIQRLVFRPSTWRCLQPRKPRTHRDGPASLSFRCGFRRDFRSFSRAG